MIHPRRVPRKSADELTKEWDRLAPVRDRQISSGADMSFDHVLVPTALALLDLDEGSTVLDIGSGTGHLTCAVAASTREVVGIEPSSSSIEIANRVCGHLANVRFIRGRIEDPVVRSDLVGITNVLAAMTMMTTPDLPAFAESVASVLPVGGTFAATITHPWFWPHYWGYDSEDWFDYSQEMFIEAPFTISTGNTGIVTTHVHRPLEYYLSTFSNVGFRLDRLIEPLPLPETQALFPSAWRYPRFAGFRWVKATDQEPISLTSPA